MSKTAATTGPARAPAPDQLPQTGGSYTRQPDGSLQRSDDAPPAVTAPAQPTTDTPE